MKYDFKKEFLIFISLKYSPACNIVSMAEKKPAVEVGNNIGPC